MSLGVLGGIQVIPLLLLALPAGQLADVVSRRKLLLATQLLLALCGLTLATLTLFLSKSTMLLPAMYGVLLLNAVTLTFARPARAAFLPQLVPKEIFTNAVTWNASIFELSSMAGPAIGGFVVHHAGAPAAYLTNGCSPSASSTRSRSRAVPSNAATVRPKVSAASSPACASSGAPSCCSRR
jgi:MFS family permease